ncbi:hypothetical protein CQW23_15399 [Capsicum baccatum]|uniref:Uncharacterized protein n=1 Tax=Capsicum baccatum TaxID=33114 RepID=A0A2G2WLZ8_CAPBA|nr:hypothetical protein CQW23_15399 [Capsicum baccatum]
MTTSSGSKLSLKLLIDTKAGKVLFAEADKNCVDFLLRILSLPVSTVIRLLNKDGMSGCLSNLYESVENMNDTYIQSKDILSKPASSDNLFILLDDVPTQEKKTFYGCNNNVVPMTSYLCSNNNNNNVPVTCYGCNNNVPMTSYVRNNNNNNNVPMTSYGCNNNNNNVPTRKGHYGQNYTIFYSCSTFVTEDPNAICPNCGKCMSKKLNYIASRGVKGAVATKGGFVKEAVTYMVMDDLVVKPMSTISSITLLSKFNIQNVSVLQEKVVYLGMKEALKMLKASFQSNTVLTSVFMSETDKNCVDFLLHILSLPVSTVIRLLKKEGMSGCLPNLFESVDNMEDTCIPSKDILLKLNSSIGTSSNNPFLLLDDFPTPEKTLWMPQQQYNKHGVYHKAPPRGGLQDDNAIQHHLK